MPGRNLVRRLLLPELELTASWYKPSQGTTHLEAEKKSAFEVCPRCATPSSSVYDHRTVRVRDAPIRDKHTMLTRLVSGNAETTGLDTRSIDIVTAFQAAHWFEPTATLAELKRVLKPDGRVAWVFNEPSTPDAFNKGFMSLLREVSGKPLPRLGDKLQPLKDADFLGPVRTSKTSFAQTVDFEGLKGLALSYSFVPREGPQLERFLTALRALYERSKDDKGVVRLVYTTTVHVADRHPQANTKDGWGAPTVRA
jgi:hypothetical protein